VRKKSHLVWQLQTSQRKVAGPLPKIKCREMTLQLLNGSHLFNTPNM
jgi:hypothetical protein